jgi:hypothetical protein
MKRIQRVALAVAILVLMTYSIRLICTQSPVKSSRPVPDHSPVVSELVWQPAPDAAQPAGVSKETVAIASLNKQIDDFNANRMPNMGVKPVDQRVSKVKYDPKLDQVLSFDRNEKEFLVLKRETDGRFKGVIEVPFHQLAGAEPDGSRSWGHVIAEFHLEKGTF